MRRVWLAGLCHGLLGLLLQCVSVPVAAAQSNVEVNAGVELDFQSPGARSLAMGSAFIGVADDATAAFVNPAGLRAISRREISFEGRVRDFVIPTITRGRLGGVRSNLGIDTIDGLVETEQDQDAGGLSFLSFVYPRSRWAIAGYRHELANWDTSVQTDGAFFENATDEARRLPIRGTMDLQIITYGVSGSFNVTPQFSVGGGLAIYDFDMDSITDRFNIDAPLTNPDFYGAPNFSDANLQNYQVQEGEGTSVGVNVGALWAPSRKFQLGAVFRQGPDFDLRVANIDPETNEPFAGLDRDGRFHVPHVFGVGGLYRPIDNGTLSVDITHVNYARLTEDFVDIFNNPPQGNYSIDNATEIHAGFEYVITTRVPIALRGGYWFDPEHTLVFSGETTSLSEASIYREGEDQHHVTFGGGVVFGRFEINGAADVASRATRASFSAVVRF